MGNGRILLKNFDFSLIFYENCFFRFWSFHGTGELLLFAMKHIVFLPWPDKFQVKR